ENKSDLLNVFDKVDFQKIYDSSPAASEFPEDNSIVLLDETHKIVYKGGASAEKNFVMIKVFNASGVDDWKEYSVPWPHGQRLVVDECYVIKKNGKKTDAERDQ